MADFTIDQINDRIKKDPDMQRLAENDPTEFESQTNQLYRSFGYRPDGSPVPAAQKAFGKISKATGIPEGLVSGVANMPIPIATTAAGLTAGGVVGGGAGAIPGAIAGSVGGELLNAKLGLRDDLTQTDAAVAAAAPLIGPLASRLKSGAAYGARLLPGGGAAMHELASDTFEKSLDNIRVDKPMVEAMRSTLTHVQDFKVKVPGLRELFDQEINQVSKRFEQPGSEAYLKKLGEMRASMQGDPAMSFKKLMSWEQGFNNLKEGSPHELWAKASGVLIEELEKAAANPKLTPATRAKVEEGVQAFKNVIAVGRKYRANESLDSLFKQVVQPVAGDVSLTQFNSKAFIKGLRDNEGIKGAFSPAEIESIKESVTNLGYLSKPRTTGNDPASLIQRSGKGAALGFAVGGYGGALAGGAAEEAIAKAVSSEKGRKIVKYLATKGKGKIDMLELDSMMGQMIAGMNAGVVAGVSGRGSAEGTQVFDNQE
jgi:hypothetical protein